MGEPVTPRIVGQPATVYRCPKTRRRYMTKRAAYAAYAKRTIFERCDCQSGNLADGSGYVCDVHAGPLFNKRAWACDQCGSPDDVQGGACFTCERHGRCTAPTTMPSSDGYIRLKARLTRWLMWLDSQAPATRVR